MSKSRDADTLAVAASPQQIAHVAQQQNCASVAFTYNDPVIFMEYAMDVADACHERGIRSVAVTAGYVLTAPRAEFYAHMDAANVDLKGFTEDFYRKVCGGELGAVLDTLLHLEEETDVWYHCGECVIERDRYEIRAWRLSDGGRCLACDAQIPGVFSGPPWSWGNQRKRVRISQATRTQHRPQINRHDCSDALLADFPHATRAAQEDASGRFWNARRARACATLTQSHGICLGCPACAELVKSDEEW